MRLLCCLLLSAFAIESSASCRDAVSALQKPVYSTANPKPLPIYELLQAKDFEPDLFTFRISLEKWKWPGNYFVVETIYDGRIIGSGSFRNGIPVTTSGLNREFKSTGLGTLMYLVAARETNWLSSGTVRYSGNGSPWAFDLWKRLIANGYAEELFRGISKEIFERSELQEAFEFFDSRVTRTRPYRLKNMLRQRAR